MAAVRNIRNDNRYKNYISALVATLKTGEALETFTENGLQVIHQQITQKLGNMPACAQQCSNTRGFKRWCQTCLQWKTELERCLTPGTKHTIKWSRLHSWAWINNARAIAEVFILPGWDNNNIDLKDLAVTLTIWHRCSWFSRPLVLLSDLLKKDRNQIFHNHTPRLKTQRKTAIFQNIRNVVNHQDVHQSIPRLANLLQVLQELEQGDLFRYENDIINGLQVISRQNKNINRKIDRIALGMTETKTEIREIKTEIRRINETISNNLNKKIYCSTFTILLSLQTLCLLAFILLKPSCSLIYSNRDIYLTSQQNQLLRVSKISSTEGCLSEATDTIPQSTVSLFEYLSHHETFIGREWLFDILRQELLSNDSHGVLLEAGMGYGKSALIAHVICANNKSAAFDIRQKLVAFHVCRFDALVSKKTHVFIHRLVYMISKELTEFNKTPNPCQGIYEQHFCEEDPYGCLDQCVIVPIKKTYDQLLVIVLDALDECFDAYRNENPILKLLKQRLHRFPKWVRFLITSRPSSDMKVLEKDLKFIRLNENDEHNKKDISAYLKHILNNKAIILADNKTKSSNNFLITKSVYENVENIQIIPASLDRYYEEQFIREFSKGNRINFDHARLVLEVICTIFRAPDELALWSIISNSSSISQKAFNETLKGLENFVIFTNGKYQLSHVSMHQWLLNTTNEQFKISVTHGHRLNANYLLNRIENDLCDINIIDLVIHVSFSLDNDIKERFSSISISCLNVLLQQLGQNPIIALVKRVDSYESINLLVSLYSDINNRDEKGISPIFTAASFGHLEAFKALISLGADVTVRTNTFKYIINIDKAVEVSLEYQFWGYGVLDIAAQNGHSNIVQFIIENNGVLFHYPMSKLNSIMLLPVHLACKRGHLNVVKNLFQKCSWMLDWQCLYYASEIGHFDLVNFVIKAGIKDECRPCEEYFHWLPKDAIRVQGQMISSETNTSKYVLFDDWMNITCETALHVAVRLNRYEIVKLLLQQRTTAIRCFDRGARTPAITAIIYGQEEIVDLFVENGILTGKEKCGEEKIINETFQLHTNELRKLKEYHCLKDMPIFHVAAQFDRVWFLSKFRKNNVTINFDQRNPDGCHLIHQAACHSSMNCLLLFEKLKLFENRLESYYKCHNGLTPLQSAIKCGSVAATELLLKYSNFEKQADDSKFEFILLAISQDLAEFERSIDVEGLEKNIVLILRLLMTHKSVLKIEDKNDRNILHYATAKGHFGVLSFLFSDYYSVSSDLATAKDLNQRTPLQYAVDMILPKHEFLVMGSMFLDFKNESILEKISSVASPKEHSIILIWHFMEIIKKNDWKMNKRLFNKLVKKQCLYVISYILVKSPTAIFESSTLANIIRHDSHGLLQLAYYMILIRKHIDIIQSGTVEEKLKISYNCKTCDEILNSCNLRAIAVSYYKVSEIISSLQIDLLQESIMKTLFSHVRTRVLSTCYDKDGFNILEIAIQSGSLQLVQHLLKLQVKSSLETTKLLLLALDSLKYYKGVDEIVFTRALDDETSQISFKNQTAFLLEMLSSSDYTRHADMFKHILFKKQLISTMHYRNVSDWLIYQLLNAYQAKIPRTSICIEPTTRHFSLIHRLAFEGYTNSLKLIEQLWGEELLKCRNLDGFTPLYLSKVLGFNDTAQYIEGKGIIEEFPKEQAVFYFWSNIFYRFFFYNKDLKCILKLRRVTPQDIYGQIKLYRCIYHVFNSLFSGITHSFRSLKWLKSFFRVNTQINLWGHTVDQIFHELNKTPKLRQNEELPSGNLTYYWYPFVKDLVKKETRPKIMKLLINLETRTCKNLINSVYKLFMDYGLSMNDLSFSSFGFQEEIIQVPKEILIDSLQDLKMHTELHTQSCLLNYLQSIENQMIWNKNTLNLKNVFQNFSLSIIHRALASTVISYGMSDLSILYIHRDTTFKTSTWLRLYYRYDYMKVLEYSRSYRKSYGYMIDNAARHVKLSVSFSEFLHFIIWENNAAKYLKSYLNSKESVGNE